ncbi:MAG: hypothetical protein KGS45_02050 [Planctomycetes bacterium]|nr:hypothetical protein [Planctomycetota bacterium]
MNGLNRFVFLSCALLRLLCCTPIAAADIAPDANTRAELRQWSDLYWQGVNTGQPAPAASTFTFTDARFNSPLVSPVRGAIRSLQRLTPAVRYSPDDPALGTTGGILWTEVRDYMRCGWLASDMVANPDRAWNHILVAYQEGNPESLEFNGSEVHSTILYPTPVEPDPGANITPPAVDAAEAALLTSLVPHATAIAANIDTSSNRMRDPLLRVTPYWDEFALALHAHIARTPTTLPTKVSYVEAAFGDNVFALITICVQAGRAYALFDPLTGQMAGPFHELAPVNARPILAAHTQHYSSTDRVEYIGEGGAVMVYVRPIGGPNPYPAASGGVSVSCYGCIACLSAVTSGCAVLCAEQPWWDTPGEGFANCMGKCMLSTLGIPTTLWPPIRDGGPIDPGQLTLTLCDIVCVGCGSEVIGFIRRLTWLPPKGNLGPAPGWAGGVSSCA